MPDFPPPIPPELIGQSIQVDQPDLEQPTLIQTAMDFSKTLDERARVIMAALQDIEISVGNEAYFNVHQLALKFRVPAHFFIRLVRDQKLLHGQAVGKAYIISATEFKEFILRGNFQYRERPGRRVIPIEEYMKQSEKVLNGMEEDMKNGT